MTDTSHPHVAHYNTTDERVWKSQLEVVFTMYLAYGRSRVLTQDALRSLMWNPTESAQAVADMRKWKDIA